MGFWQQQGSQSRSSSRSSGVFVRGSAPVGNPAYDNNPAPAPKQAAPAPAVKFNVWNYIQKVGQTFNSAQGVTANSIARLLPGGQNDFKQQQDSAARMSKDSQFIRNLQKSNKIKGPQAAKLLGNNGAGNSQAAADTIKENNFKSLGQSPIESERTVAKAIVRGLPGGGGMRDIKAEQDRTTSALKDQAFIRGLQKSGKISKASAGKIMANSASGAADASSNVKDIIKAMPSKKDVLISGGMVTLDALTGGAGTKAVTKRLIEKGTAAAGRDVGVNNLVAQRLMTIGREANAPKKIAVKDLSTDTKTQVSKIKDTSTKIPVTDTSSGAVKKQVTVKGDGFTMAPKSNPQSLHMSTRSQDIQAKLDRVAQGKSSLKPDAIKTLVQERKDIKAVSRGEKQFSDVYPNHPAAKAELPGNRVLKTQAPKTVGRRITFQDLGAKASKDGAVAGERSKSMGADVGETSLEQKVARPPKEKVDIPLNGDGNFMPKTKTEKVVAALSRGVINPIQTAMNKGHVKFVNVVNSALNKGATNARTVEDHLAAVEKQHKLDNHSEGSVSAELESGKTTSKTAQMMQQGYKETGQRLVDAGVLKASQLRDYYAARGAEFAGGGTRRALGLSKSISNAKQRAQEIIKDELGIGIKQDKYKTNADFRKAVTDMGGRAKSDLEAYREYRTNAERAIRNANLMKDLKGVAMNDGRPAVVTKIGNKTSDYKGLNDGAVFLHPDAHGTLDTLHQGNSSVPTLLKPIAALNSKVKRLVTYNAVVHGKNLLNGDVRERGVGAFSPFSKATEADKNEYVAAGGILFEHDVTKVMDELSKGSEKNILSRGIGKIRSVSDKILFEHYGNHVAIESFVHARDKLLKNTSLTREEASKIAARSAKASIMTLGEAERSVIAKQGSRVALFAGQYFQSTFKLASRATALGTDKTLSKAGQRAEMFAAQKQVARGAAYTFATAQAINYRATGHPTWENHGSKVLPVFYVDKATGQEYHITNFYGQLGDLANLVVVNSTNTLYNKSAPVIREGVQWVTGKDGQGANINDPTASNGRQLVQKVIHAIGDMVTPGGVGAADVAPLVNKATSKISSSFPQIKEAPGAPGAVNALKVLGFSASAKDQNDTDKLVDKLYQGRFGNAPIDPKQKAVIAQEAKARQDIKNGDKNSSNVQAVKGTMSAAQFTKFMKSGASGTTQRHFDSLPTEDKFKVINGLSSKDLQAIDTTSAAKSVATNKSAYEALIQKGETDQTIKQTLQKAGYDASKLNDLVRSTKADAKARARASRGHKSAKWTSPATQ